MVINTNITAQSAATQLGKSSQRLAQSLARLSSGSKITQPADDSAGLAVSMKLGAQISRNSAALTNVANATSFSQTQDGYLQKIGDALTRMSELTVAAQDVTKTTSDRKLYNQEFQTLATYINDAVTKDFNGVSLFSGNALNVTTDSEGGSFAMTGISGDYVAAGVTMTTSTTSTVADAGNTQLGTLSPSLASGGSDSIVKSGGDARTFTPSDTINDLVNFLNSTSEDSASYNSTTGQLSMTTSEYGLVDDFNSTNSGSGHLLSDLGFTPSSSTWTARYNGADTFTTMLTHQVTTTSTTTTSALDISTVSGAQSAMTSIKNAINQLASDRATVGANEERLSYTSAQLGTLNNNLAAAKSNITDVDVAQESTNYAQENILVQSGTAMLAQANAMPQSILKLLG
jgi:flagellin